MSGSPGRVRSPADIARQRRSRPHGCWDYSAATTAVMTPRTPQLLADTPARGHPRRRPRMAASSAARPAERRRRQAGGPDPRLSAPLAAVCQRPAPECPVGSATAVRAALRHARPTVTWPLSASRITVSAASSRCPPGIRPCRRNPIRSRTLFRWITTRTLTGATTCTRPARNRPLPPGGRRPRCDLDATHEARGRA